MILALWVLPALLGQLLCTVTSDFGPAVIWATLAVLGAIGLVQVGMVGVACILAPLPGGLGGLVVVRLGWSPKVPPAH